LRLAAAFAGIHYFFIPKVLSPIYETHFDAGLISSRASYVTWVFEPGSAAVRLHSSLYRGPAAAVGMIAGLLLAGFIVRRTARRQWSAAFCVGWFLALLAPILPLTNHVTPYYLTLPFIGLAWLAGWGICSALEAGGPIRALVMAVGITYILASVAGIEAQTKWFAGRAERMRIVVGAVKNAASPHPESLIVLAGVDQELLDSGIEDNPFRLVGAERVALAPGTPAPTGRGGNVPVITREDLERMLLSAHARVLAVTPTDVKDITPEAGAGTF